MANKDWSGMQEVNSSYEGGELIPSCSLGDMKTPALMSIHLYW